MFQLQMARIVSNIVFYSYMIEYCCIVLARDFTLKDVDIAQPYKVIVIFDFVHSVSS